MNANVITMDREAAKAKADAYRANLSRRKDEEYLAALTVFTALEQGFTVIDIGAAIREGGFDAKMRPNLAIARADRKQVHFRWTGNDDSGVFDSAMPSAARPDGLIERVNFNRRHGQMYETGLGKMVEGFAIVPMIPADVRPKGQERDWHILWEVEQWADRRINARADRDPYLLRRLSGDLFVVLAEWDLTEVERLVTQGRARVQS